LCSTKFFLPRSHASYGNKIRRWKDPWELYGKSSRFLKQILKDWNQEQYKCGWNGIIHKWKLPCNQNHDGLLLWIIRSFEIASLTRVRFKRWRWYFARTFNVTSPSCCNGGREKRFNELLLFTKESHVRSLYFFVCATLLIFLLYIFFFYSWMNTIEKCDNVRYRHWCWFCRKKRSIV